MRTKHKKDGQIACEARRQAAMFVCRSHVHAAARSTPNEETGPLQTNKDTQTPLYMGERAAENVDLYAALVYEIKTDK